MADAQVQVKYVQTKRGHKSLVHNGYRYNDLLEVSFENVLCNSYTHNGIIVKFGHLHNHQPEHEQLKGRSCSSAHHYEEAVSKLRTPEWDDDMHHMVEQLPTFHSCKTSYIHQTVQLSPTVALCYKMN
ncbi:hypothetical protein KUTeg_017794 [Tegillarca granosa]|uniref:Uncharacterized protein n=1 Tax=Tegillarca granosa TaxID=220873 RepID=A0ABQ9EJZ1_TEGGR|nr:hypothetical protein KUTeg_017794 [Tegillarca granosa]